MPITNLVKQPSEPIPEVYKDMHLVQDNPKESNFKMPESVVEEKHEIPPKQIFDYNLKHLKSFKIIRRKYKLKNLKSVFVSHLKVVLQEYPISDNELNDDLLLAVLNIAEDYFFYGSKNDRNEMKKEVVEQLMLKYFRDDKKLLEKTIGHIYHKVQKSNLRKRLYQRFKYFF